MGAKIKLQGEITKVNFSRESFHIVAVRASDGERFSVKGKSPVPLEAGANIEFEGKFVAPYKTRDGREIRTFEAEYILPVGNLSEEDPETLVKWLASAGIPNVGEARARQIVEKFGADTLDMLREGDPRLKEIRGITSETVDRIKDAYKRVEISSMVIRDLMSHGMGMADSINVWDHWKEDALAKIRENPYSLTRIRGIGFQKADKVAASMGFGGLHEFRLLAAIRHALTEASEKGCTWLPADMLASNADDLLKDVDAKDLIQGMLRDHEDPELRVVEVESLPRGHALSALFDAEKEILDSIRGRLSLEPPSWGDRAVPRPPPGITLSDSQRAAVERILRARVGILTGGPGTGKTTVTRTIVDALSGAGLEVVLCSPTGRAAARLSESVGRDAATIHRTLGVEPREKGGFRFVHDAKNPLRADFVVVDESSMVDVRLMRSLLCAMPPDAGLLLVGDADQLPSVGAGNVFGDLIESGVVPVSRLTEIHRQAAGSKIIVAAHEINRGVVPNIMEKSPDDDFFFLGTRMDTLQARIVDLASRVVPERFGFTPDEIQVLTLMHRGPLGTVELNRLLQRAINPDRPGVESFDALGATWREGDRVMQTRNDYDHDVFNGDQGVILKVNPRDRSMIVGFGPERREVKVSGDAIANLGHAYCITVHKSQGSEYPAVVMPMTLSHAVMLNRKIVYTGLTRAKRFAVMAGDPEALAIAVKNRSLGGRSASRWTWLGQALKENATQGSDEDQLVFEGMLSN